MSKCQFDGCENEATRDIPVLIGIIEEPGDVHVCEEHYREMEFFHTCSMEIVSVKEVRDE